ncbi:MAG: DUF2577 family protein [Peptococcaceae bacterium]|nr:DUF2577 family protein [Peptococcaceae bacterium]
MEDNPFNTIIQVMRQEGSFDRAPSLVLGKVQALSPLQVLVEGTVQTRDTLLANAELLAGSVLEADFQINGQGSITGAGDSISGNAELRGEIGLERQTDSWSIGDQLLLLPVDEHQKYIILCKVVSL